MSRAQLTSTVEQNTGGAVAPFVAGKNFLANGNFDYWQRGTSFSSGNIYTADRWYTANNGGTFTISQESSVVPSGSTYSIKWTTSSASSYVFLYQALEDKDANFLSGKTITVSALVRAQSGFSGDSNIYIETNTTANTMTGGTWTSLASSVVTPNTSGWSKLSLTYAIPAGTAGIRFRLGPVLPQASGTGLYFSQAQVEVGSVATPFSRAGGTLQGELALCQRYYFREVSDATATYADMSSIQFAATTSQAEGPRQLPVVMRTAPTTLDYANLALRSASGTIASVATLTISASFTTNAVAHIQCTGMSGLTANQIYYLIANNSSSAYLGFGAEL
jgi:hypothetical protein